MSTLPPIAGLTEANEYEVVPHVVDKFKRFFNGKPPKWLDAILLRQIQNIDNDQAAEVVGESVKVLEEVLAEFRQSKMHAIVGGKVNEDEKAE